MTSMRKAESKDLDLFRIVVRYAKSAFNRVCPSIVHPQSLANRLIIKSSKRRVIDGPFKGMIYVESSVGSVYLPKLLGSYEMELHAIIEIILASPSHTMLNIGAGEGYYAVGFARIWDKAQVVTYESDEHGRRAIANLARANQVEDRIIIRGTCIRTSLAAQLTPGDLVIADVEGGELDLLDPNLVPVLKNVRILVETHDFIHAGTTQTLIQRFKESHSIYEVCSRPRDRQDIRFHHWFLSPWIVKAAYEWRPAEQEWLFMRPHNGHRS